MTEEQDRVLQRIVRSKRFVGHNSFASVLPRGSVKLLSGLPANSKDLMTLREDSHLREQILKVSFILIALGKQLSTVHLVYLWSPMIFLTMSH